MGLVERTLAPCSEISMPLARADLWVASTSCQTRSNSELTGTRGSLRRLMPGTGVRVSAALARARNRNSVRQKMTIPASPAATTGGMGGPVSFLAGQPLAIAAACLTLLDYCSILLNWQE